MHLKQTLHSASENCFAPLSLSDSGHPVPVTELELADMSNGVIMNTAGDSSGGIDVVGTLGSSNILFAHTSMRNLPELIVPS